VKWIEDYQVRRKDELEYYFIIENDNLAPVGTVRIYNINRKDSSFTFGSFIVDGDLVKKYSAFEAITLVFDLAFNKLSLKKCFFDCRKNNVRANSFYTRYGAIVLKEDDLDIFYTYNSKLFNESKKKENLECLLSKIL
jgi:RimJ/RimL family protein N-acetyltransferase